MRRGLPGAEDDLNVYSADDDDGEEDEEEVSGPLFAEGQRCDVCASADGRVGIDSTCRGAYDGTPSFACYACLPAKLKEEYGGMEGVAIVVEPFGDYGVHYYYRLDEMPAYGFVREDVEGISWLPLALGDDCARCGAQSRIAWLTRDAVDPGLPENRAVFLDLEDAEHLCGACAAGALAEAYEAMQMRLMTVEVPRAAQGLLIPAAE